MLLGFGFATSGVHLTPHDISPSLENELIRELEC
jgi:hypothetical protein